MRDSMTLTLAASAHCGLGRVPVRAVSRHVALGTLAIISVKRFAAAKQRLAGTLDSGTRRALAEAMVCDVLTALRRTPAIDGILLVTPEPAAAAIGHAHGAEVLAERSRLEPSGVVCDGGRRGLDVEAGYNGAARAGIQRALDAGAQRVLLMPGDCPTVDPAELSALLSDPAYARSVTVVPDRHGTGTNGMLLSPPDAIDPAFGPGSCRRHLDAADNKGINGSVLELPSLMLDVDTPDDLDLLRLALLERSGVASRTRALLARLDSRRAS